VRGVSVSGSSWPSRVAFSVVEAVGDSEPDLSLEHPSRICKPSPNRNAPAHACRIMIQIPGLREPTAMKCGRLWRTAIRFDTTAFPRNLPGRMTGEELSNISFTRVYVRTCMNGASHYRRGRCAAPAFCLRKLPGLFQAGTNTGRSQTAGCHRHLILPELLYENPCGRMPQPPDHAMIPMRRPGAGRCGTCPRSQPFQASRCVLNRVVSLSSQRHGTMLPDMSGDEFRTESPG